MIFRLTQKLAKKLDAYLNPCLPVAENPFLDWHAHLFTADRARYIIVTNTASLYSMVMPGRGIRDENEFIQATVSLMRDFMSLDGNEFYYKRFVTPMAPIMLCKTGDRRILGSMNDLIYLAKVDLKEFQMSPFDTSKRLNETPMSVLANGHPKDAFRALRVKGEAFKL